MNQEPWWQQTDSPPVWQPQDKFEAFREERPRTQPTSDERTLKEKLKDAPGTDFVPVLNTYANWDDMGPWGRTGSIALDALDIATLGGGKLITAPVKAALKIAARNDPFLEYMRFGGTPTAEGAFVPSRSNIAYDFTPQGMAQRPEAGVSVYQTMYDPKTKKWVLRNPPADYVMDINNPMNPHYGTGTYSHSPRSAQEQFMQSAMHGSYRPNSPYHPFIVSGTPMTTRGTDLEVLLDPRTVSQTPLGPKWMEDVVTENYPSIPFQTMVTANIRNIDPVAENIPGLLKPYNPPPLTNFPNVSFDNYDIFGNRINPEIYNRIPNLPWTIPFTTPTRAIMNQWRD